MVLSLLRVLAIALPTIIGLLGYQLLFPTPARRHIIAVSIPQYTFLISRGGLYARLFPRNDEALRRIVLRGVESIPGEISLVVENFTTGQYFATREFEQVQAASLYKIPVMIALLAQAKAERRPLSPEVIDSTTRMITLSSNDDGQALGSSLGWDRITKGMQTHGFMATTLSDPPLTSAFDMARMLEHIYNEKLIDPESSRFMFSLLTKQQVRDRIPKLLPDSAFVANKTGDLDGVVHDVAVVKAPQSTYLLVILGRNISNVEIAKLRMAELSKAIYDYFESQFEKPPSAIL